MYINIITKKLKEKKLYFFPVLLILIVFLGLLNPVRLVHASEFSDELEYESYESLNTAADWYDGVETFYYDYVNSTPKYWHLSLADSSTCLIKSESGRENYMDLNSKSSSQSYIRYYVNASLMSNDMMSFEFWTKISTKTGQQTWLEFKNSDGQYLFEIYFSGVDINFDYMAGVYPIYLNYNANEWYHIRADFKLNSTDVEYTFFVNQDFTYRYVVDLGVWHGYHNDNHKVSYFNCKVQGLGGASGYSLYLDALGYICNENYNFQIKNTPYLTNGNYISYDENDFFSMRETIMDKYPSSDNNYRTYLMSDKIITDNYVDKNRVLRIAGTDDSQNKYKVLQFYLDDLNESDSFQLQSEVFYDFGKSDYEILNGSLSKESSDDVDLPDGIYFEVNSTKAGIDEPNILSNDNLTLHTIDAFPDSSNDGFGYLEFADYSTGAGGQIKVLNPLVDKNALSFDNPNLRTWDYSTGYPSESCNMYFDEISYGNFSFDMNCIDLGTSKRFEFYMYDSSSVLGMGALLMPNDWQKLFEGLPEPETTYNNEWIHINIAFESRDGISDNSGWNGLNSNKAQLFMYRYSTETWYSANLYSFDNNVDEFSKLHFGHGSGSYTHDVYYHDLKFITQDETLHIGTMNITMESNEVSLGIDLLEYELKIGLKTNISQNINVSLYNFDDLEWNQIDIIGNITDWIDYTYPIVDINPFLSGSNTLNVSFIALNDSYEFAFMIDYFKVKFKEIFDFVGNQSIRVRIDSFDESDNLINIYHVNLDFNKTFGILTWDALYRESLAIPRWTRTPTNPIFNFADYMPEGTVLTELQINIHVFLTYHSNQKWIYIRTDVCINNEYSMSYSYDKIINAGNSDFYYTQEKLKVAYIDYFNYNNASDYTGASSMYTYNNLRGYRCLKLNSTDYKFNFLDAGYFKTDLKIPDPPPPEAPDEGDVPDEEDLPIPDKGEGDYEYYLPYYWFYLEEDSNTPHNIGDESNPLIPEGAGIENWDMDYTTLKSASAVRQFGFDTDVIKYIKGSDLGDWVLKINIGLGQFKWSFNWLRNGVAGVFNAGIMIGNLGMIALQYLVYAGFSMFSFLIMGLLVGIVVVFLWNSPLQWIWALFMIMGWWIYAAFAIVFYWIIWLWDEVIYPFFEWCMSDLLPLLIALFILLCAVIIAAVTTLLAGEELGGDFYKGVLGSTEDMLTQVANFLFDSISICIENIDAVIYSIILYVMFIAFCYVKYWYCDAKGNISRAEELKASFDAYMLPIRMMFNLYDRLKDSIPFI